MAFAAVVDASTMVALFGKDQAEHARYSQWFAQAVQEQSSLTSTGPCVTEASHLPGLPQPCAFLHWLAADASPVFLASDTGVTRIMTLDVRDFSCYRLADGRAFENL